MDHTIRIYELNGEYEIPLHEPISSLDDFFLNSIPSSLFINPPLQHLDEATQSLIDLTTDSTEPDKTKTEPMQTFTVEGDIGDCSICLETFQKGETFRRLPCSETVNHMFHVTCIDKWLENHTTCPTCRAVVREEQPLDWAVGVLHLLQS